MALKRQQKTLPVTARRGNQYGMIGMGIAVGATLLQRGMGAQGFLLVAGAIAIGGTIGTVVARRIQMTALPQLVAHDGWDYHLHATPSEAPLPDRIAVETAMGLVDVVRSGELDRLHVCAADGCTHVLVDLSKNRSRCYCSTACANRVNVAAFRARRRA